MNYRVFVDTYGKTHYYRKQLSNSTTLISDVSIGDTTIFVVDALKLFNDDIALVNTFNNRPQIPQTAWVGNERIEFYSVDLDSNSLVQCLRGTAGTSNTNHSSGVRVWDGSERQSLMAQAASASGNFTIEDVRKFPWPSPIYDFFNVA